MYAIVQTGGKQYRVAEGDTIAVEKLPAAVGDEVQLTDVVALSRDGELTVGTPYVDGAAAVARVVEHGRAPKIIVFKFKAKIKYRRKRGHRQAYTRLVIEKITA